jgi:hypothetical protein
MTALALTVAIASVEVLLRPDCAFKTFNRRNFRPTIACFTGRWDLYILKQVREAHHVYPHESKQGFESVYGFHTVHHPVHGAWVPAGQHIIAHGPYNRWWR